MIADRRRSKRTTGPLQRAAAQLRGLARRSVVREPTVTAAATAAGGVADRRVAARKGRPAPPRIDTAGRARRRGLSPRGRLVVAILVLLLGILGGGWVWLRDSSLVSVRQVSVTGATGPDAAQISSALTAAARRMTTLDVNLGRLRAAVARYPVVADLRVNTHFPHRMQIRVVERIAVGTATVNGRQVAVSADGMVLADVPVSASLPVLSGAGSIRDGHLAGGGGQEVALLAAAPDAVLSKLSQVSVDPTHGLAAQFRSGPIIYFGDAGELSAKWTAAVAVLADPGSAGAAYIDVTDPHRPAAGLGSDQAGGAASATAGTGSATAAGTGGATAATTTPASGGQTASSTGAVPSSAASQPTGVAGPQTIAPAASGTTAPAASGTTAPAASGTTAPTGASTTGGVSTGP